MHAVTSTKLWQANPSASIEERMDTGTACRTSEPTLDLYWGIERGERNVTLQVIADIARALGVEIQTLFPRERD